MLNGALTRYRARALRVFGLVNPTLALAQRSHSLGPMHARSTHVLRVAAEAAVVEKSPVPFGLPPGIALPAGDRSALAPRPGQKQK